MQIHVENNSGKVTILIRGELCIQYVSELANSVMPDWQNYTEIDFDLSGVTEVDAAGMQCLAQFKRMAIEDDKPMRIIGHSASIVNGVELLGLARHFGDPLIIASDTGVAYES